MTPPVVLRVPQEGRDAVLRLVAAWADVDLTVVTSGRRELFSKQIATAFLSAIQPRQERALEAALRAVGLGPLNAVDSLREQAREAYRKAWNADAGREEG